MPGRLLVALLALTACSHAAPAPLRVDPEPTAAPRPQSRRVVKHACAYELAGPPTAVVPTVTRPAGAALGGKVLLAFQQKEGLATAIHARLFEPTQPPGADLVLTPKSGVYTEAEVTPHGSRFFVTWHQQRPTEKHQGRWVEADGTLGPIVDLPFASLSGVGLLAHESGFSAAYEVSRDQHTTLFRVDLDTDLKPTGASVPVDETRFINGLSLEQRVLANGDIWLLTEAAGRSQPAWQARLVRTNASGAVVGTAEEISASSDGARLPTLVEVPGGVLFAWIELKWHENSGTLWTRKLDLDGKPLGPPLQIGASGSEWEGLELVIDAGEPLLITQVGRNIRLDTSGSPVARATAVEPMATKSIWLPATPTPFLAWARGDDSPLMLAALQCSRDTVGPR